MEDDTILFVEFNKGDMPWLKRDPKTGRYITGSGGQKTTDTQPTPVVKVTETPTPQQHVVVEQPEQPKMVTQESPKYEWKDITDVRSARSLNSHPQQLHIKYLASASTYPDKKIFLKKINAIGKAVTDVYNRFPRVADIMQTFPLQELHLINKVHLDRSDGAESNMTMGLYMKGGFKVSSISVATVGRQESSVGKIGKTWSSGTGLTEIATHELGHHVWYNKTMMHNEFNAFYENNIKGTRWNMVSNYAKSNVKEFFAEGFAYYTHPDYGNSRVGVLPPAVEKMFDKWIGTPKSDKERETV